jgi:osmotically-inducible protein OsmY
MTDETKLSSTSSFTSSVFFEDRQYHETAFSEHDLRRRVLNFLSAHGILESHSLTVEADYGTIVIRGTLPSPRAKRLCIECCRHVAGVMTVIDQVEVELSSELVSTDLASHVRQRVAS